MGTRAEEVRIKGIIMMKELVLVLVVMASCGFGYHMGSPGTQLSTKKYLLIELQDNVIRPGPQVLGRSSSSSSSKPGGRDKAKCTQHEGMTVLMGLDFQKVAGLLACAKFCAGRPILACLGDCATNFLKDKVTPPCTQCIGDFFSCGSKKCDNKCQDVMKPPLVMECVLCFQQKCGKMAMACVPGAWATRVMRSLLA